MVSRHKDDRNDWVRLLTLKKIHFNKIKSFRIPYLKATVLETLRLGNVVPMPLPRIATQDIEMREYIIPKVEIPVVYLHHLFFQFNFSGRAQFSSTTCTLCITMKNIGLTPKFSDQNDSYKIMEKLTYCSPSEYWIPFWALVNRLYWNLRNN